MDNRPIGIFDSGLGGLTAVKALRELLPEGMRRCVKQWRGICAL